MRATSLALIATLSLTFAARGREEPYLPGGEEVKKAVEARRGKTVLSKLAASMKPGQWAELPHKMPGGIWSAPKPSKGLHIGTWSDDGHWDSRTGQFLFFGVRQTRKLIAYSEEKNAWRDIPFEGKKNAPVLRQKYGHQYSGNSLDPERSRLFTGTCGYDIVKDTWFRLEPSNKPAGSKSMCWEYFSAMDGLFSVGRKPKGGTFYWYSMKDKAWKSLGRIPVHGYHSLARHNPFRKELLLAGGNDIKTVEDEGLPHRPSEVHRPFQHHNGGSSLGPLPVYGPRQEVRGVRRRKERVPVDRRFHQDQVAVLPLRRYGNRIHPRVRRHLLGRPQEGAPLQA